jgi:uncharacterized protein (DUF983 family)
MSTTPPEQPPTTPAPSVNLNLGALMPTPGNAELAVYILGAIVVAIIALAADSVNAPGWVDWFKWVTSAYLISRGIAKASRVLER